MFMDGALAARLEATEGHVAASFIDARGSADAVWRQFGSTIALCDGADSPLTQTFGLGLDGGASAARLAEIEALFTSRGLDVMHEVCPLAGVATYALLAERGYRPIELSTVLVQRLGDPRDAAPRSDLRVRPIVAADRPAWIETSIAGWSSDPEIASAVRSIAEVSSRNPAMTQYLVEHAGAPIATGSLGVHGSVAILAGASTVPAARGLGAQALLLAARLAEARQRGCELAMMVAEPGSTSQRNAERNGFRVAYTRVKWRLAAP
jgi:GNAT superfamily N-acetyltransferase